MRRESILIAEWDPQLRRILANTLEKRGPKVVSVSNGKTAIVALSEEDYSIALIDLTMPEGSGFEVLKFIQKQGRGPLVIVMISSRMTADGVEAMRFGAFDYLTKPFYTEELEMMVEKALQMRRIEEEVTALRHSVYQRSGLQPVMVGESGLIREILGAIEKFSETNESVLIEGEDGTGKELTARLIHLGSARASEPFIPVKINMIPQEMIEGNLFGYERGAFRGALKNHAGYLEQADGGTIFLGEIGRLPLPIQAKLADVIKHKTIVRMGDKKKRKVNLRIMASSSQDLGKMCGEKRFKRELFDEFDKTRICTSPLRKRMEDISKLTGYFLEKFAKELDVEYKIFSKEALRLLEGYDWPGNIQELENVIKRVIVLSPGRTIAPDILEPFIGGTVLNAHADDVALEEIIRSKLNSFLHRWWADDMADLYSNVLQCMERPLIELILDRTRGNQIRAAEILGLNRNTLRKKIVGLKIIPKGK